MSARRPSTRARTPRPDERFDPKEANREKAEKLRMSALRRLARTRGLELRHSSRGYSLNTAGKRIDDRSDLTLDEVAARLEAPIA
jgi:hypothetical protein